MLALPSVFVLGSYKYGWTPSSSIPSHCHCLKSTAIGRIHSFRFTELFDICRITLLCFGHVFRVLLLAFHRLFHVLLS